MSSTSVWSQNRLGHKSVSLPNPTERNCYIWKVEPNCTHPKGTLLCIEWNCSRRTALQSLLLLLWSGWYWFPSSFFGGIALKRKQQQALLKKQVVMTSKSPYLFHNSPALAVAAVVPIKAANISLCLLLVRYTIPWWRRKTTVSPATAGISRRRNIL